ncbi:MAG: 30S ribosomal protein S8 [Acidobacteriota bacterium]|nr:30S ribosomal protein S8 [Acidobacteriota bacterium]MDH3785528.1 30S ribosomal protein S8 [Acidobacteriota bacterium]
MSMTDPISDLLVRLRNGATAKHDKVVLPASKMKAAIVGILKDEGYIDEYSVEENPVQGSITVHLKYTPTGDRAITGLERVSKPGRRVYCNKDEIPKVLNGLGITILSTSRGIKTGSACRREGVGGEILCNVW